MATKKTKTAAPAKDAWSQLLGMRATYFRRREEHRLNYKEINLLEKVLSEECKKYAETLAVFKRADRARMIICGVWQEVAIDRVDFGDNDFWYEETRITNEILTPTYKVYRVGKNGEPSKEPYYAKQSELVPLP